MLKKLTASVCLPLFFIGLTGCETLSKSAPHATAEAQTQAKTQAQAENIINLDYKQGQVLSFVFIDNKDTEDANAARQTYYQTAFPLARKLGLSSDTTLRVPAVPVGDFKPSAVGIFSWPDTDAELAFSTHPDFPDIKALRPLAWDELRIATAELEKDMTLTFDPLKTYTLASAWFNPENPDHYAKYMAGIKSSAEALGGRFVYKMHHPKLESHGEKLEAPGQITLVEWETRDGLAKFQKSQGFKQNVKYLSTGTTRFEIIVIAPRAQ